MGIRIDSIVKIEKKQDYDFNGVSYVESLTDWEQGYNQGQEELGNKKIGLDEKKIAISIEKWLLHNNLKVHKSLSIKDITDIASALKAKESEIIIEVE